MQNTNGFIKKKSLLLSILGASLLATLIIPIAIFIFFHPYYDRSEDLFYPLEYNPATVLEKDIKLIKQPIFSAAKNLAKITVKARLSKRNSAKLSLIGNGGKIIRSTAKPHITYDRIIWEFIPIKDSSKQTYDLTIEISNKAKRNVKLTLIPNIQKYYSVKINGESIDGQSLAFFTESKFTSPKEKMQTFYKRIITYKPEFIQRLFFPALLVFLILSAVSSWIIFLNISNVKHKQ